MKNKKALIIGIIIAAVIIIILVSNFFNKDITDTVDNLSKGNNTSSDEPLRGSIDDPNSNINKLLAQDKDAEIVLPDVKTTKLDSSYSIKYTDVAGDKFEYTDYSDSARQYYAYDSWTGIYVLNVLGRACKENNIEISTMNLGEDILPDDPNFAGVSFESNRYKVSIFFKEDMTEANVKIDIIG